MKIRSPNEVIGDSYRIYKIKSWIEAVCFGDGSGWCITEDKETYKRYMEGAHTYWILYAEDLSMWKHVTHWQPLDPPNDELKR